MDERRTKRGLIALLLYVLAIGQLFVSVLCLDGSALGDALGYSALPTGLAALLVSLFGSARNGRRGRTVVRIAVGLLICLPVTWYGMLVVEFLTDGQVTD
jgi:membrane protease YdiL (CAAX protease family)